MPTELFSYIVFIFIRVYYQLLWHWNIWDTIDIK